MRHASTRTAVIAVIAAGLLAQGCAATRAGVGRRGRTIFASLSPAPAGSIAPPATVSSPAGLLSRGFRRYEQEDYQGAVESFHAAIDTHSLNDAGRALAYWQIAIAERRLGHEDPSLEALSSFMVVGQDLLEPDPTRGPSEFVDSFELPRRLAEAGALISAAWARREPEFGRSPDNSVPVRSEAELEQFLDLAVPCSGASDLRIERAAVARGHGTRIERVKVSCESGRIREEYFVRYMRDEVRAAVTARSEM